MAAQQQKELFPEDVSAMAVAPWERAAAEDRVIAQVVFNIPVDTVFHYLVPDGLRDELEAGQRLEVPFGRGDRLTVGYCVGVGAGEGESKRRLKQVAAILDRSPLLSAKMLQLTRWMADHFLCSWGQVLETVVPSGVKRRSGTREMVVFRPSPYVVENPDAVSLTPKQQAVMQALLRSDEPLTASEITAAADCGTGPIDSLRKKGLIEALRERRSTSDARFDDVVREPDKILNPAQRAAVDDVLAALRSREHQTFVLHGVTGSGKTEVYLQACREVVEYGRQAIVLVPEISLTPQTIRRFRARFDRVAVLHSHLGDADRHHHWRRIAEGNVDVVVGARSAVFAPTPQLGLIVIDEEHETTFKQDAVPRYHARDVARERARMEKVPLILGTATPTLESWRRVQTGVDALLDLPKRVGNLPMPPVIIVDVRHDPNIAHGAALGRSLVSAMKNELDQDGQVILFLNLRGFSPTLWCRACGSGVMCPHCDITLTWHRDRNIALCHSCDYHTAVMTHCPQCGHAGVRHVGIGTQRLEAEVKSRFPEAPCVRMDSDSMKKPGSHDEALEAFRRGDVKILLGTQMIAKGLDFPNVTLVGVVSADTLLNQPDFRAAERTFQLISQVAGRTGRGPKGGRVFVQSCLPTEPAIVYAARHDYHGFANAELAHREELRYPPFQRLVRVVIRGPREPDVVTAAKELAARIRVALQEAPDEVRVLGPAPAPVVRLRNLFRYHFQIAAEDLQPVRNAWKNVASTFDFPKDVETLIDVDPLNMM